MKSVVWLGARRMELQNAPMPQPGVAEVLLRVGAAGICGSDLSGYLGQNSLRVPPLIMGHEFAGVVTAVGTDVTDVQPGAQVVVNPIVGCNECFFCGRELENLCVQRSIIGIHQPGAFAEFVVVPAANCTLLPEGVSLVGGSLAEPLACGVRAARIGGVAAGSRVMVLGAGPIGLMCVAAAQRQGGEIVLVTDVQPGRLVTAQTWGAQHTLDVREANAVAHVRHLTNGLGVDIAIDAVGTDATRRAAIEAVRADGTVVFLGLHENESHVQANHIVRSEIRIHGSFSYTRPDFAEAVAMLAAGTVRESSDWLEERDLEACDDSFAELIDRPPAVAKIVLRP